MKIFYVSPWFLLALAAIVMAFTGALNTTGLVILSLIALALLGRLPSKRLV